MYYRFSDANIEILPRRRFDLLVLFETAHTREIFRDKRVENRSIEVIYHFVCTCSF